jgi:hypothetical protein
MRSGRSLLTMVISSFSFLLVWHLRPFHFISFHSLLLDIVMYFTEKELRDAAAAEVAQQGGGTAPVVAEEPDNKSRKRKALNADEKAKQK